MIPADVAVPVGALCAACEELHAVKASAPPAQAATSSVEGAA